MTERNVIATLDQIEGLDAWDERRLTIARQLDEVARNVGQTLGRLVRFGDSAHYTVIHACEHNGMVRWVYGDRAPRIDAQNGRLRRHYINSLVDAQSAATHAHA